MKFNSHIANHCFSSSQPAWTGVKLMWGWVYWFGTPWFESDKTAFHFLHAVPPSAAALAGCVESCVWAWLAAGLIGGHMFLKLWIPSPLPYII